MGKPEKGQVDELLALSDVSLKGGKILRQDLYEDGTGEARIVAVVDYGIKGVKKFDASVRELDVANKRVEPTLETLSLSALQAIAGELGVSVEGRPNKVKLIVAIRKKIAAEAEAEVEADDGEFIEVASYDEMEKADLKGLGTARGIDIKKSWNKDKMIAALVAADEAEAEADDQE